MQIGLSNKAIIITFDDSSFSGTGPLSKFFKVVNGEAKVILTLLSLDCLHLKIIHMPKWQYLGIAYSAPLHYYCIIVSDHHTTPTPPPPLFLNHFFFPTVFFSCCKQNTSLPLVLSPSFSVSKLMIVCSPCMTKG